MSLFNVLRYKLTKKTEWNTFINTSANGTFLFYRDFMEYHSHRFEDASLLIYKNTTLMAVFPAHRVDVEVFSHQGLTYGGMIFAKTLKLKDVLMCFKAILKFYSDANRSAIHLKSIPSCYYTEVNFPLDYILHCLKASCYRIDVMSVVIPGNKTYSRDRKAGIKRALKHQLVVKEVDSFEEFWHTLLIPTLQRRHQVNPVHTLEEITYLKRKFPKQIRQFNVYHNQKIVAGTTIFESQQVAHSQYIASDSNKNNLGSLDLLHAHLLEKVFVNKPFFDFGISNENNGVHINEGLLYWKEGFGARALPQRFYKIDTSLYNVLDTVFI